MHTNHKLLVCIAFHYYQNGLRHLSTVMNEFLLKYAQEVDVDIIIDTNSEEGREAILKAFPSTDVRVHNNLSHPFHLTWIHRWHIKSRLNVYDVFMYVEYDMLIPYENYKNYLENWDLLRAYEAVPALMRVERHFKTGVFYSSDAEERLAYPKESNEHVRFIQDKTFVHRLKHPLPYHAVWIAPQSFLQKNMPPAFTRLETSRERAASFLIWEMAIDGHIQMGDDGKVSPKSYVFHLPSNYCNDPNTRLGKIPLEESLCLI